MIQGDNSWKSKMIENLRADLREEGSHEKGCMISHVKRAVQGTKRTKKKKKKTSVGSVLLLVLNKRVIILWTIIDFHDKSKKTRKTREARLNWLKRVTDSVTESVSQLLILVCHETKVIWEETLLRRTTSIERHERYDTRTRIQTAGSHEKLRKKRKLERT